MPILDDSIMVFFHLQLYAASLSLEGRAESLLQWSTPLWSAQPSSPLHPIRRWLSWWWTLVTSQYHSNWQICTRGWYRQSKLQPYHTAYKHSSMYDHHVECVFKLISEVSNWSQKFQTDLRSVDYIFCVGKSLIIVANQSWNMFSVYTLSFLDPSLHVSPPYWRENSLIVLDLEVCKQKLSQ